MYVIKHTPLENKRLQVYSSNLQETKYFLLAAGSSMALVAMDCRIPNSLRDVDNQFVLACRRLETSPFKKSVICVL